MPYLRLYSTSTGVKRNFAFFIFLPLSKVRTFELFAAFPGGFQTGNPAHSAPRQVPVPKMWLVLYSL